MAKKVLTILGIVLASAFLFVVGTALLLFLAPGAEIFGIRYVANGQDNNYYCQYSDPFAGDIYIDAVEVHVEVSYIWGIKTPEIEYKQNFIGFTRSERVDNQIEQKVQNGNLYVKTYDIEKFLYAHNSVYEDSYLKVRLPQTYATRNVTVKAKSSNVTFNATGPSSHGIIDINTPGTIEIEGNLNTSRLNITTKKELTLGNNISAATANINGGTYDINIDGAKISKLNVETSTGNLRMLAGGIVNFKSNSGSLKPINDNGVNVNQLIAETYSGGVNVNNITGTDVSSINTHMGKVNIERAINLDVENKVGSFTIGKASKCNVIGGNGVVRIGEIESSIEIKTTSGYVYLGSEEKCVVNPKVETNTGKIFANNVSGNLNLTSNYGSVQVSGKNVVGANIKAGDKVTAAGLAGNVQIECNGDLMLDMEQLSGNVNINALDGCKNVTLNIKDVPISSFNYDFLSTKSRNAHVYAGEELIFYPSSAIKSSTVNNSLKTIKIQTTYADMYVYTK